MQQVVQDTLLRPLAAWESFYVIVGSSAGALTGLQFVVLAFVTDRVRIIRQDTIDTFTTPSIVHFSAVLFLAAVLSAPWPTMHSVAIVVALCGIGGLTYTAIVARRATKQDGYKLVIEDWVWHVGLPLLAYALQFVAAVVMLSHMATALFVVAATTVVLLFVGIHAAWDTVTYVATEIVPKQGTQKPPRSSAEGP